LHNELPWQRKHWRSILGAYRGSPYFKTYADELETFYQKEWKLLSDLNFEMLEWFLRVLGIKTPVLKAADYKFEGTKSLLVLDMCHQLGADVYIFGALGKDYADEEAFKNAGVLPYFQEYHHPKYKQINGEFVSHLSTLDLLFNEGPNSLEILMSQNISRNEMIEMKLAWKKNKSKR